MTTQTIDCPEWEYEEIPDYDTVLTRRARKLLITIRTSDPENKISLVSDIRASHGSYFRGLTPPKHSYYAGHYRGEPYACLRDYMVEIPSDPLVGHSPGSVPYEMLEFTSRISTVVGVLDRAKHSPNAVTSQE